MLTAKDQLMGLMDTKEKIQTVFNSIESTFSFLEYWNYCFIKRVEELWSWLQPTVVAREVARKY